MTPRFPTSTTPTPAPPKLQQCHPHTLPPRPPPRGAATDASRGGPHQRMDCDAPANTHHPESPLPRPPRGNPVTRPDTRQRRPPPKPTPPPPSHAAPPAAALTEPYALHNPAAVRQHLRGLETRGCNSSTPPAPPSPSGRPSWSRRPPWGRASETSSSKPSSKSPHATGSHSPPLPVGARPPWVAGSGCPPSTGGDT